jgi:glycosyltransferase involved in cell wall biosynthesis
MRFSIITPSFRGSAWLKLCVASVADQGVDLEHIVQDSCSDDGTQDWLPKDPRVKAFIEKDRGMYDAVNRGLRRATGDILAYINCDEQYAVGALHAVENYFAQHPDLDMVFTDTIVVDDHGAYLCERRALTPQTYHTLVSGNLSFLTCGAFFRRRVVEELGVFFEPSLKDVGDCVWALEFIKKGARMGMLREFTSIFTETGANMSRQANATRERQALRQSAPALARWLAPAVVAHFRLRKLWHGLYKLQPHDYAIYTRESPDRRKPFHVANPAFRWQRSEG